jgi:hypothetical protein
LLLAHCDLVEDFYGGLSSLQPADQYRRGMVLTDAQCLNWFAQLDGTRRASTTARGFTNGLFGLAGVVTGFTGVDSNVIGIVTATGRTLSDGFGTIEANYMLTEQLPSVFESFQAYRSRVGQAFLESGFIVDEISAKQYLQEYEATCSSLGLQQFVNKAVQAAGRGEALSVPLRLQAEIDAIKYTVGGVILADRPLTEEDLTYIAVLAIETQLRPAEPAKAKKAQTDADADLKRVLTDHGAGTAEHQKAEATKVAADAELEKTKKDYKAALDAHQKRMAALAASEHNREIAYGRRISDAMSDETITKQIAALLAASVPALAELTKRATKLYKSQKDEA